MSTIAVDNIQPSAGGTAFSVDGVAKAWVSYNHFGASVLASENITSVTDNSTGDFTVNIANDFANANYNVAFSAKNSQTASVVLITELSTSGARAAGAHNAESYVPGVGLIDLNPAGLAYHGTLA